MRTQHIRYFLAVCDELNFTRAAKRCGVSQPSLTNAIKHLEREVGGALFLRSARPPRVKLTVLARKIHPICVQMDSLLTDLGTSNGKKKRG
jgi:DNA-binding transcriptional LysR family regulator